MHICHYYFSTSTSGWQVSLGRQNLQGNNPNEVSRSVARIILHPNYDSDTLNNDVALLRLSSPVKFTDYIRPVCLAASGSVFNKGTDSWVTGWGTVEEGGENLNIYKGSFKITYLYILKIFFLNLTEFSCYSKEHTVCCMCVTTCNDLLFQWLSRSLKLYKKWRFQFWETDSVTVSMESVQSQTT